MLFSDPGTERTCAENICEHNCTNLNEGGFICSCRPGYKASENNRNSCDGIFSLLNIFSLTCVQWPITSSFYMATYSCIITGCLCVYAMLLKPFRCLITFADIQVIQQSLVPQFRFVLVFYWLWVYVFAFLYIHLVVFLQTEEQKSAFIFPYWRKTYWRLQFSFCIVLSKDLCIFFCLDYVQIKYCEEFTQRPLLVVMQHSTFMFIISVCSDGIASVCWSQIWWMICVVLLNMVQGHSSWSLLLIQFLRD